MPRSPRLDLPHVPQHVVQRGNDRRPCFFLDIDHVRYLDELRDLAQREGCAVHAYVLMTNHVHLLVTPTETGRLGRMMQALGRRYVRYVNDRYHRTGTLWEGRYKACPVDGDTYLLRCYRYIELNPVRPAMVVDPADYRWSSYRANALGRHDPLLTPHPGYLALGADPATRQQAYRVDQGGQQARPGAEAATAARTHYTAAEGAAAPGQPAHRHRAATTRKLSEARQHKKGPLSRAFFGATGKCL